MTHPKCCDVPMRTVAQFDGLRRVYLYQCDTCKKILALDTYGTPNPTVMSL